MERKKIIEKIPEATLARTLEHHKVVGSTPDEILTKNPGKTYAEAMSDDELKDFIMKEVGIARKEYDLALKGDQYARTIMDMVNSILTPNISYLRKIGRLPEELKDFYPEKEFSFNR